MTMVYGPIAAFLVEFFPARIRYTSLSHPVPHRQRLVRRLPAAHRGRAAGLDRQPVCAALIYPIVVALITVVVGGLFIRESRHVRIWDEVGGHA